MVAGLAYGAGPEWVDAGTHDIFVRRRAFRRPTLPRYGLIDHTTFDRALQTGSEGAMIEDLWTPFFALSSNLSTHAPRIHQRGPVWQAIRASGSVPGVLPPFFTTEGEMLVDGALMDNIPLAPMKALKSGPNVVVALRADPPTTYPVDYESIPGLWQLALGWLNPFSRRRLPPVPSVVRVITLSMLANRRPDLTMSDTDILIKPDLPSNVGFMSWDRHNEIFLHTYRATAAWIARELAEPASALQAIVGASH
jgi:NTE family protein